MTLLRRDFQARLPTASHASGVYVWDTDGRVYLDGSSGAVTVNIGHGVPAVLEAMRRQAERVCFTHGSQFESEPTEELARAIAVHSPGDLAFCAFTNSGSEANELAHKFAIQYWRERGLPAKTWVLSRWTSYHGSTLGACSMSGHPARRRWYAGLALSFAVLPPPYCYRCPFGLSPGTCGLQCADALDTAIRRTNPDQVGAVITEPVVGAAGAALTPPAGYYERIRAICDEHGVLWIADEVMTGFGRTGTWFASEHWDAIPDIITFGKGVSSGYTPMAGMVVRDALVGAVADGSGSFATGHTFGGNPLSSAITLAVVRYMEDQRLIERAVEHGPYLRQRLDELAAARPMIGEVRGLGLMQGLEFVADRKSRQPFPTTAKVTARVVTACRDAGLIIYPCAGLIDGARGDGVLIAPPLCIERSQIDELVTRFGAALDQVDLEMAGMERSTELAAGW